MKCSSCGAEVNSENRNCPYCGSEIIKEPPVTNITNNFYSGNQAQNQANVICPRCGSRNIKFRREEAGNKKSKTSKQVYYRTVGICQDCGNTWNSNAESKKSGNGIGWWILAIMFWPIALSVWFYKTDKVKLDKKYRIIILAAVWVVLLIIGAFSPKDETPVGTDNSSVSVSETTVSVTDNKSAVNNPTYTLTGETLGEYGREVVLNAETDMPVSKYLYKLPAGTYTVTTEEKYAAFSVVKDEIGMEEGK